MRRKDREVTDLQEMREFLEDQEVCRVAVMDKEGPYIVPLNYGYELSQEGNLTLYLHSGKLGKKMELFKKSPMVGLELDGKHQLVPGTAGCTYTYQYFSLIGQGRITILEGYQEKVAGLTKMMAHFTEEPFAFDEKMIEAVAVLKVEVTAFTCKKNGH